MTSDNLKRFRFGFTLCLFVVFSGLLAALKELRPKCLLPNLTGAALVSGFSNRDSLDVPALTFSVFGFAERRTIV